MPSIDSIKKNASKKMEEVRAKVEEVTNKNASTTSNNSRQHLHLINSTSIVGNKSDHFAAKLIENPGNVTTGDKNQAQSDDKLKLVTEDKLYINDEKMK